MGITVLSMRARGERPSSPRKSYSPFPLVGAPPREGPSSPEVKENSPTLPFRPRPAQTTACVTDLCNAPEGATAPTPAPLPAPLAQCPGGGASSDISCWFTNATEDGGTEVINMDMGGPGAICMTLVGTCTSVLASPDMGIPGCTNETLGAPLTLYAGFPGPNNQSLPECELSMIVFGQVGFTSATVCANDGCNAPPGAQKAQAKQVQTQQQDEQQAQQLVEQQAQQQATAICPTQGSAGPISCYLTNQDNVTGAVTTEISPVGPGGLCVAYTGSCTQELLQVGIPGCVQQSDVGSNFTMYGGEMGPAPQGVQQCIQDVAMLISTGLFPVRISHILVS